VQQAPLPPVLSSLDTAALRQNQTLNPSQSNTKHLPPMTPEEVRFHNLKVQVTNKWGGKDSSQKKNRVAQKNFSLKNMIERGATTGRSIQPTKNI
jgi:hypothetical protein